MSDRIFTVNFDKVDELKELGYGFSMVHTGDIKCFVYKKTNEDTEVEDVKFSFIINKTQLAHPQTKGIDWQKEYDAFIDNAITNIKNQQ